MAEVSAFEMYKKARSTGSKKKRQNDKVRKISKPSSFREIYSPMISISSFIMHSLGLSPRPCLSVLQAKLNFMNRIAVWECVKFTFNCKDFVKTAYNQNSLASFVSCKF